MAKEREIERKRERLNSTKIEQMYWTRHTLNRNFCVDERWCVSDVGWQRLTCVPVRSLYSFRHVCVWCVCECAANTKWNMSWRIAAWSHYYNVLPHHSSIAIRLCTMPNITSHREQPLHSNSGCSFFVLPFDSLSLDVNFVFFSSFE